MQRVAYAVFDLVWAGCPHCCPHSVTSVVRRVRIFGERVHRREAAWHMLLTAHPEPHLRGASRVHIFEAARRQALGTTYEPLVSLSRIYGQHMNRSPRAATCKPLASSVQYCWVQ